MSEVKWKKKSRFPREQILEWEKDDCVNFAIALARVTGWLLHVDWATNDQDAPPEQMSPLRVYVGDSADNIFDVYGIKKIQQFTERTIYPILKSMQKYRGVKTRFYSEEKLRDLPLRVSPCDQKICAAEEAIRSNEGFLAGIPARSNPKMPAYIAGKFAYGWCGPYAEALHQLTGLKPIGLEAVAFSPIMQPRHGYFHSAVFHPDGEIEDSWGKGSVAVISKRFEVTAATIDYDGHAEMIENQKRNSPENYARAYEEAIEAIKAFREI